MKPFAEKIFSFPKLYNLKIELLGKINGIHSWSVNHLINNKEIIDIGCGSKSLFYTPENAKKRVGIDSSSEMIQSAKVLYPNSEHYVASAEKLPFDDKSFDVALIQFVLHHIEPGHWKQVLTEAKRVSRHSIIIFDHVKHDRFIPACIQQAWWDLTDGGRIYRKEKDWQRLLVDENLGVLEYKRVGALFGNICFYHLSI